MISEKISEKDWNIRQNFYVCTQTILTKLYFALVYPYLTYCIAIWWAASENDLNKFLLL